MRLRVAPAPASSSLASLRLRVAPTPRAASAPATIPRVAPLPRSIWLCRLSYTKLPWSPGCPGSETLRCRSASGFGPVRAAGLSGSAGRPASSRLLAAPVMRWRVAPRAHLRLCRRWSFELPRPSHPSAVPIGPASGCPVTRSFGIADDPCGELPHFQEPSGTGWQPPELPRVWPLPVLPRPNLQVSLHLPHPGPPTG